jgi:hypothetical protein
VTQTTANPPALTFSRGQTFSRVNFGNRSATRLASRTGAGSGTSGDSIFTDVGTTAGQLNAATVGDLVRTLFPSA